MKTIGDGEDLSWTTPFQSSKEPLVSKHLTHSLYPFFDNWPKNTLKKIIKINLPWKARIPKGYKLVQTHPYMLDDNRFTTMAGVLHPHLGLAAVGTIPMWIHTTDDEEEITLEETTEALNQTGTDQNLDQISQTMRILKEKFLGETIIMHQN